MDNANSASSSAATAGGATAPNSTELMIALSQIQQLIPLLDYRPGGLTHLLPTLLTPLMPVNDSVPGESMQRYRANVEHAFRVANELVGRVSDASSVGSALTLAEKLMRQGDDKARMLRVRKKRRLFVEQEKVLEVNSWGPPIPPRATTTSKPGSEPAKTEGELTALLPSQNTHPVALTTAQKDLPPPTTAQAAHKYLLALHSYLKTADSKGLLPAGIPLKHVKARISSLTPDGLTLELQVGSVVKAVLDATLTFTTTGEGERGELQSVELAALTIGGVHETITSTTPSTFPIFRTLSSDILAQTNRAVSANTHEAAESGHVWTAYTPITEAVARLILAAAQFQS